MRCSHCDFDNLPGAATCQVCESRLPTVECHRCHFQNPPEDLYCGGCGHELPTDADDDGAPDPEPPMLLEPIPPAPETPTPASPIALVGFGAILALGSAAFPWYLLGSSRDPEEQSLTQILETGWEWFPGIPLVIIGVSTVLSTFIAIFGGSSSTRPLASIVLAMATLFAAGWLWMGFNSPQTWATEGGFTPAAGAMLATVGAIVLVASLLWMAYSRRSD